MRYWAVLRQLVPEDEPPEGSTHWTTHCLNEECPCSQPTVHKHLHLDAGEGWGYCFRCKTGISLERFIRLLLGVSSGHAAFMMYGDRENRLHIQRRVSKSKWIDASHLPLLPGVRLPPHCEAGHNHPYLQSRSQRVCEQLAKKKGLLYCHSGEMSRRIVVPLRTTEGKVVGYSGRATYRSSVKNLYPTGFPKSKMIYNEECLSEDWCVLVEGELGDAFSVMRVTPRVVALYGNSLHLHQALRLTHRGVKEVYLALDGKEDPVPTATRLFLMGFGVKIVPIPYDKDPGDMSATEIDGSLCQAKRFSLTVRSCLR